MNILRQSSSFFFNKSGLNVAQSDDNHSVESSNTAAKLNWTILRKTIGFATSRLNYTSEYLLIVLFVAGNLTRNALVEEVLKNIDKPDLAHVLRLGQVLLEEGMKSSNPFPPP